MMTEQLMTTEQLVATARDEAVATLTEWRPDTKKVSAAVMAVLKVFREEGLAGLDKEVFGLLLRARDDSWGAAAAMKMKAAGKMRGGHPDVQGANVLLSEARRYDVSAAVFVGIDHAIIARWHLDLARGGEPGAEESARVHAEEALRVLG